MATSAELEARLRPYEDIFLRIQAALGWHHLLSGAILFGLDTAIAALWVQSSMPPLAKLACGMLAILAYRVLGGMGTKLPSLSQKHKEILNKLTSTDIGTRHQSLHPGLTLREFADGVTQLRESMSQFRSSCRAARHDAPGFLTFMFVSLFMGLAALCHFFKPHAILFWSVLAFHLYWPLRRYELARKYWRIASPIATHQLCRIILAVRSFFDNLPDRVVIVDSDTTPTPSVRRTGQAARQSRPVAHAPQTTIPSTTPKATARPVTPTAPVEEFNSSFEEPLASSTPRPRGWSVLEEEDTTFGSHTSPSPGAEGLRQRGWTILDDEGDEQ